MADEQDLLSVVIIGQDLDDPNSDILIGIGPYIDSDNNETNKLFFRIQRGKNDPKPIRVILGPSQVSILNQSLNETVEDR